MSIEWISQLREIVVDSMEKSWLPFPLKEDLCESWKKDLQVGPSSTILYTSCMYHIAPVIEKAVENLEKFGVTKGGVMARLASLGTKALGGFLLRPDEAEVKRADGIVRRIYELLRRAGVEFGLLDREIYSGALLYELGLVDDFARYARRAAEYFKKRGVRRIITVDPHTQHVLEKIYPKYVEGFDIEVVSYLDLIKPGGVSINGFAIHDSCLYARFLGKYERIRQILATGKPVEDPYITGKDTAGCCGGPIESTFPGVAKQIAKARVRELAKLSRKVVVMGKNNVASETKLHKRLEEEGNEVWETDLGAFLVQLSGEEGSHITAPAIHLTRERAAELLREKLGIAVPPDPAAIAQRVREFLREKFMKADVGITGANALAADTGAVVLVENEANIRLTSAFPPVHIVYDGVEKIVPTLIHALYVASVQAAYAGLYPPTYINVSAGPSSTADIEMHRVSPAQGPKEYHVVLVDNGRRAAARDPVLWEALLCIRCGRCHLHCPVYRALGRGFGVPPYTGPMGVLWTAVTRGIETAGPHALKCVHAGNCREVCPMDIDMPQVIHEIRSRYLKGKT